MDHDDEISFTLLDGMLRSDRPINLPDGARGLAILRQLFVRATGLTCTESLAAIRRIGESGVFNSGGHKLSCAELDEGG